MNHNCTMQDISGPYYFIYDTSRPFHWYDTVQFAHYWHCFFILNHMLPPHNTMLLVTFNFAVINRPHTMYMKMNFVCTLADIRWLTTHDLSGPFQHLRPPAYVISLYFFSLEPVHSPHFLLARNWRKGKLIMQEASQWNLK